MILRLPRVRADGADPGEEGVARKIVAAGKHGAGGRKKAGLQRDEVARRRVRGLAGRHAHSARDFFGRHAVGGIDRDHHPRADGPEVHFFDEALEIDDADAVENGRGDARGPERHRQEAGKQRPEGKHHAERHGALSRQPGRPGEDEGHERRQPQRRLTVGREVERDAPHGGNRQPKEEAPLLDLASKRAVEGLAPVGRPRGGAGKGARGRDVCAAPSGFHGACLSTARGRGKGQPVFRCHGPAVGV